jgi:uncharacterized membrane protein YbhN (UPF0104 family)
MASGLRTLRNGMISLLIFFGLLVALLLAVPGLRSAADRMSDAKPLWVILSIALELLSCAGYVVLFELIFGRIGRRLSARLALSELAVNSVVSVSGMGGIALGAWVLRSKGISVQQIAKRSVLIFTLSSAVNVGAVVLFGVLMGVGLLSGSTNPLLTFLPAGGALLAIIGTLALARWAARAAGRLSEAHGRLMVAFVALSGGVQEALRLIAARDWRLLGSVGYWFLDNLCLFTCFVAYGHTPALPAVVMAYLVGMLANSIPIPGGLGVVEGGLVGMLLLYGERPASVVLAAVITYRAISLWIPSIVGGVAFLGLRREIGKPLLKTSNAASGAGT